MKQRRVLSTIFAALVTVLAYQPAEVHAGPIGFVGQTTFAGTGHGASISGSLGGVRLAGWAGEINWEWAGAIPEGFTDAFFSYCVDITQFLQTSQSVEIISTDGFTNGVAGGGTKAAWLFNTYAGDIRNNVGSYLNERAAALQLAIWDAMYDSSTSSDPLSTGAFTASASTRITNYARGYISALYAADWASADALILNTSEREVAGQDQITNIARVPEPGTALLMTLGMASMVRFRRRRSRVEES